MDCLEVAYESRMQAQHDAVRAAELDADIEGRIAAATADVMADLDGISLMDAIDDAGTDTVNALAAIVRQARPDRSQDLEAIGLVVLTLASAYCAELGELRVMGGRFQ